MADFTDDQVDEMVSNIESHDDINGTQDEPKQSEEQPNNEEPKQEQIEQALSFKTRDDLMKHKLSYRTGKGKEVEEDLATILQRASGGYHYAQNMGEYNKLMETYNTEHKPGIEAANTLKDKYGKLEDYAKENPEWYDHWTNAYETRHTGLPSGEVLPDQQQPNMQNMFKDMLSQELGPIKEYMTSQQLQLQNAEFSAQDNAFGKVVEDTRKAHPNVDFDHTDPATGKSLEHQTLEYMKQTGIDDFNTAFKAYYHDNLVKMQVEAAIQQRDKTEVDRRKSGIVDVKPGFRNSRPVDHKKSWDELMRDAQNDPEIFGNK